MESKYIGHITFALFIFLAIGMVDALDDKRLKLLNSTTSFNAVGCHYQHVTALRNPTNMTFPNCVNASLVLGYARTIYSPNDNPSSAYNNTRLENDNLVTNLSQLASEGHAFEFQTSGVTGQVNLNEIHIEITARQECGSAEDGWRTYVMNHTRLAETGNPSVSWTECDDTGDTNVQQTITCSFTDQDGDVDDYSNSTGAIWWQIDARASCAGGGGGSPQIYTEEGFVGELLSYSIFESLKTTEYMMIETQGSTLQVVDNFDQEISYIDSYKLYGLDRPIRVGSALQFQGLMKLSALNNFMSEFFNNINYDVIDKLLYFVPNEIIFDRLEQELAVKVITKDQTKYVRVKGNPLTGEYQTFTIPINGDYRLEYNPDLIDITNISVQPYYIYRSTPIVSSDVDFSVEQGRPHIINFDPVPSHKYILKLEGYYEPRAYAKTTVGILDSIHYFVDKYLDPSFFSDLIFPTQGNTFEVDYVNMTINYDSGFDGTPPLVEIQFPLTGDGFSSGLIFNVSFNATDGNQLINCTLLIDDDFIAVENEVDDFFSLNFTEGLNTSLLSIGLHNVTVECSDRNDNVGSDTNVIGVGNPELELQTFVNGTLQTSIEVVQNETALVSSRVICNNARCLDVNGTLLYNATTLNLPDSPVNDSFPLFLQSSTNILGPNTTQNITGDLISPFIQQLEYDRETQVLYVASLNPDNTVDRVNITIALLNDTRTCDAANGCIINSQSFANSGGMHIINSTLMLFTDPNDDVVTLVDKLLFDAGSPSILDTFDSFGAWADVAQPNSSAKDIAFFFDQSDIIFEINYTKGFADGNCDSSECNIRNKSIVPRIFGFGMDNYGADLMIGSNGDDGIYTYNFESNLLTGFISASGQNFVFPRGVTVFEQDALFIQNTQPFQLFGYRIKNPFTCHNDILTGSICDNNLTIQATGPIGTSYFLQVNYTSSTANASEDDTFFANSTRIWQINITAPPTTTTTTLPSTCPYVSGDYVVTCSDQCVITSPIDVGGNDIFLTGVGLYITEADITGWNRVFIQECRVRQQNGQGFR